MTLESDIKAQPIRVLDVLFLGPAMILAAQHIKPPVLRAIVGIGGFTTIVYNAANWMEIESRKKKARRKR